MCAVEQLWLDPESLSGGGGGGGGGAVWYLGPFTLSFMHNAVGSLLAAPIYILCTSMFNVTIMRQCG